MLGRLHSYVVCYKTCNGRLVLVPCDVGDDECGPRIADGGDTGNLPAVRQNVGVTLSRTSERHLDKVRRKIKILVEIM